jgi:hypothetical protein
MVVVAVVVLMGAAALTIDLGIMSAAAQRAQEVTDAAAFSAGCRLPDFPSGRNAATDIVEANNDEDNGIDVIVDTEIGSSDLKFYSPYDTVPEYGVLGSAAYGVRVTANAPVDMTFARTLGFDSVHPARSCGVVRMPVGGAPIAPMWITNDTEYLYGQQQQLLMANGPVVQNIPGSFGWLVPASGQKHDFDELLRGHELTEEQLRDAYVSVGDTVNALTGLKTGQWRGGLETASDGLGRLQRAEWSPWDINTFKDFHDDNPRTLIVPMVEYLGGNGANAEFEIQRFGAFWLEAVDSQGNEKAIWGRFVQYSAPGAGGDPLSPETVLWVVRTVE